MAAGSAPLGPRSWYQPASYQSLTDAWNGAVAVPRRFVSAATAAGDNGSSAGKLWPFDSGGRLSGPEHAVVPPVPRPSAASDVSHATPVRSRRHDASRPGAVAAVEVLPAARVFAATASRCATTARYPPRRHDWSLGTRRGSLDLGHGRSASTDAASAVSRSLTAPSFPGSSASASGGQALGSRSRRHVDAGVRRYYVTGPIFAAGRSANCCRYAGRARSLRSTDADPRIFGTDRLRRICNDAFPSTGLRL